MAATCCRLSSDAWCESTDSTPQRWWAPAWAGRITRSDVLNAIDERQRSAARNGGRRIADRAAGH